MVWTEQGARMGRGGVIIAGLAIGGSLASGCSAGSPTAATVTTESVRVGHLTEVFDTLTNLKKSLTQELTPGQQIVPAGIDRNFKTQVAAMSGTSATVTTCDDGSKFAR